MQIDQDAVDNWLDKLSRVSNVFYDGAKEKVSEVDVGAVTNSFKDLSKKVTSGVDSLVKGVKEGSSAHNDPPPSPMIHAVRHPSPSIELLTVGAGVSTVAGISLYLLYQEKQLRTLLRAMSSDWRDEVPDGLIGPVGHMFRPFVSEVRMQAEASGSSTPRNSGVVDKAKRWWCAICSVTARPSSGKLMYHGAMAVVSTAIALIRWRYHRATVESRRSRAPLAPQPKADAIEQMAFEVASTLKGLLRTATGNTKKAPEKPVTRSGEAVPSVHPVAMTGSIIYAGWHWAQFLHCLFSRGTFSEHLRTATRPICAFFERHKFPAAVKAAEFMAANIEALALVYEVTSCTLQIPGLILPRPTTLGGATASLRLASLARMMAIRSRLFDDVAHTLHSYGALDRQFIYWNSIVFCAATFIKPCNAESTPWERTCFAVGRLFALANIMRTCDIFSRPRAPTNESKRTVQSVVKDHTISIFVVLAAQILSFKQSVKLGAAYIAYYAAARYAITRWRIRQAHLSAIAASTPTATPRYVDEPIPEELLREHDEGRQEQQAPSQTMAAFDAIPEHNSEETVGWDKVESTQ